MYVYTDINKENYTYICTYSQVELLLHLYVSQNFFDCITSHINVSIPKYKYKYN